MPGRVVGTVSEEVEFKASPKLDAQAAAAGALAGESFEKAFESRVKANQSKIGSDVFADLKKQGAFAGDYVGDAFTSRFQGKLRSAASDVANAFSDKNGLNEFAKNFDSTDEAATHLRDSLALLAENGNVGREAFNRYSGTLSQWQGEARKTDAEAKRVEESMRSLGEALQRDVDNHDRVSTAYGTFNKRVSEEQELLGKIGSDVDKEVAAHGRGTAATNAHGVAWGKLSANTRQWTAIISAVVGAGADIAVLAQAAGAGVFEMAGAFGAVVLGGGVFAAALKGIKGPLKDIPKDARPAVAALRDLKKPLTELQKQIQGHVFAGLAGDIKAIGKQLIPELRGEILGLSTDVRDVLGTVLTTFESPTAVAKFQSFLGAAGPVLKEIVNGALAAGGAVTDIFLVSEPYVQRFANATDRLFTRFSSWTSSVAGQNAIRRFFDDGTDSLDRFLKLVGSASKVIEDLVTPASVKRTNEFLDNLNAFMPSAERLLKIAGNLDLFGVLAELLRDTGDALKPLTPGAEAFATVVRTDLINGISRLTPELHGLANEARSLQPDISKIASLFIGGFTTGINSGISVLRAILPAAKLVADILAELPQPVYTLVADFILLNSVGVPIGPMFAAVATGIKTLAGAAGAAGSAELPTLATSLIAVKNAASSGGLIGALGGVASFLTGPWGAAIGGAVAILGVIALASFPQASKAADDYRDSLDNLTGAITNQTRAQVLQMLQASNASLPLSESISGLALQYKGFGLNINLLTDAFSGNKEAGKQFNDILDKMRAAGGEAAIDAGRLSQIFNGQKDSIEGARQKMADYLNVTGAAAVLAGQAGDAQDQLNSAIASSGAGSDLASSALSNYASKLKDVNTEAANQYSSTQQVNSVTYESVQALVAAAEATGMSAGAALDYAQKQLGLAATSPAVVSTQNDIVNAAIRSANQLGLTGQKADEYAAKLLGIPLSKVTQIDVDTTRAIQKLSDYYNFLTSHTPRTATSTAAGLAHGGLLGMGLIRNHATGFVMRSRTFLTPNDVGGEAGPEAVVPLAKPLNQISPEVRAIAAFAQGKLGQLTGSGSSPQRVQNFQPGAIVLPPVDNREILLNMMLDRMAQAAA